MALLGPGEKMMLQAAKKINKGEGLEPKRHVNASAQVGHSCKDIYLDMTCNLNTHDYYI